MDTKKSQELPESSRLDLNNNLRKSIKPRLDEEAKEKSINKTSLSNSTTSSTNSVNTSMSSSTVNSNQMLRKTSKSDSSYHNQLSYFKLKTSPEHRKFSLSLLTNTATERLIQRKSSLQPQFSYHHQLPHQTILPNFMGLFLSEDQQQLISNEQTVKPKQESISSYLQRKASKTNQQINTSSITNLTSLSNVPNSSGSGKKKNSEPLLPSLLREEFLFTQMNALVDDVNLNTSFPNENENLTTADLTVFDSISPSNVTNLMANTILNSSSTVMNAAGNGKRRTTLSSLIATNKSIGAMQCFRSNNGILEQQDSSLTNQVNQTNFLNYLPFRRSKRAQSDPWIGERLIHRLPYTANRRFTLGTTADNLFQSEEEVFVDFFFLFLLLFFFDFLKKRG